METPITNKEMDGWHTFGTSIMLKNNIVLSPEIKNAKGAILNMIPNESPDKFLVDVQANIGNELQTAKGGTGMALFYVSDVDKNML
jgi:hypothetical protein